MKWAIIILFLFPPVLQAQEYQVKDRCMGSGTHAMVVEFNEQYYVVVTPQYFQSNWMIRDLLGISMGGYHMMYYSSSSGGNSSVEVRVLSRWNWKYAGFPGARAVCRQITQGYYRYRFG